MAGASASRRHRVTPSLRSSDIVGAINADDESLEPGTPIDLDNCAREPIHIPGSVQPRGVLLVVREPELTIVQASANLDAVIAVAADQALGRELGDVIGKPAGAQITKAASVFGDLRERNPVEVVLDVRGVTTNYDAILHRESEGVLLVELEIAAGPRPFAFPNTYLAVRGSVAELNRTTVLSQLYDITARAVRELTGFDRVMVYRYDHEYNGEVVSEAKREDLNTFMGQHYPASDIPAQARSLYEKNWLRLISDVDYEPAALVPSANPMTGLPLDLTNSTLRSVSPIHLEYLQNMGVRASMSISLLRNGKLWGLIACHHYSGAHLPPYGVRVAAEFLGSTLSLRLVDRYEDDEMRARLAAQQVLAKLTAATLDESGSLVDALLGAPDLLDLICADGVAVCAEDRYETRGAVPGEDVIREIAAWAVGTGEEVAETDSVSRWLPELAVGPDLASGVLVVTLPDAHFVVWVRAEVQRSVDWGGDPRNKAIAIQQGDAVRMSPRKSFERWKEVVRLRSLPWTGVDTDLATQLRHNVVESLYQRSRRDIRLAEALQRSLLPEIPRLPDWSLSAHYEPAAGGRIGGDWYDAFELRDGRLVVALGDVAGHGIAAAGVMAQLRNALRAYLFDGVPPVDALVRLNDFTTHLLTGAFATLVVACIDPVTGRVLGASAGHPIPLLVDPDGVARPAPIVTSPPLGVPGVGYRASEFTLLPGAGLVLFSDGLIERRDEDLDTGLDRLADAVGRLGDVSARTIWNSVARTGVGDDTTVVALRRPG